MLERRKAESRVGGGDGQSMFITVEMGWRSQALGVVRGTQCFLSSEDGPCCFISASTEKLRHVLRPDQHRVTY